MVTPQRAPLSCILKFQRATLHYNALKGEVANFFNADVPVVDFEPDATQRDVLVRVRKPLPPEWGVLVGDCLYNLRSGLDHLISITSLKHGGSAEDTEFPIFLDGKKYAEVNRKGQPTRGSGVAKIASLPKGAKAYIESIQPYNRTSGPLDLHPLWLLHTISNHDKHRMVDIVHAAIESGYVDVDGLGHGRIERFSLPVGALEDGAVVLSLHPMLGKSLAPHVKVNFKFSAGIAFSPKGPGRGQPVLDTLIDIHNFIDNDIIPSFQPYIT